MNSAGSKRLRKRRSRSARMAAGSALACASVMVAMSPCLARAQDAPTQPAPAKPADSATEPAVAVAQVQQDTGPTTDIFSRNTVTVLLDVRAIVANGSTSWVKGGLGKTRFDGGSNGNFRPLVAPVEADLVWEPRFTSSLSANVSVAWQRDQENAVDLIEAYVTYLPRQTGRVGFSARAGLMWPEISLEHSTGGAWTAVNTITPSAINSWVGEEVKVVGGEATIRASLGQHDFAVTGALFGYNDTSGTLLSFRGWALHDEKATAFGHFPLPPLNPFIRLLQASKTRSTIELDHKVGFYGRLEWRPPQPFGAALFYYDNEGNPQAFLPNRQWGWRTRFWNLGVNADLGPNTRLLAQGMTGSTIMGFKEHGVPWVHTDFRSAYALVTHSFGRVAVTGRLEAFQTREHGSEMPPRNSEDGWAATAAVRWNVTEHLTALFEVLNVHSWRGTRVDIGLASPFESQTVFQAALRFRI